MKASALIQQCAEVLQDLGNVTWTPQDLLRGLSRAAELVAMYRPDACAVIRDLELQPGSLQVLPPEGHRFLDAYFNMGDGSEPGRVIRVVDRVAKDASDSRWMTQPESDEIEEVVVDERVPRQFWVSPPAGHGVHIQIGYTVSPVPLSDPDDDLTISDQYAPALVEWALYMALARDSEETPNYQRAMDHKATFFNMLGVKTMADNATTPNRPDAGKQVPPE